MAEIIVPHTILASLNHLKDDPLYQSERPYEIWLDEVPEGLPKTNVQFELHHNISLVDARSVGLETFSVEEQGFQFLHQPFPKQFIISGSDAANSTPEQRQAILGYLEHMADYLCESLNGTKAICYDWRVSLNSIFVRCDTPGSKVPSSPG